MTLSLKIPLPESRFGGPRAARPLQKRAARTGRRRPVPEPAILAPITGPARQVQSVQFSIARSAQFSVAIDTRGSRPKSKLSTKAGQVQ